VFGLGEMIPVLGRLISLVLRVGCEMVFKRDGWASEINLCHEEN